MRRPERDANVNHTQSLIASLFLLVRMTEQSIITFSFSFLFHYNRESYPINFCNKKPCLENFCQIAWLFVDDSSNRRILVYRRDTRGLLQAMSGVLQLQKTTVVNVSLVNKILGGDCEKVTSHGIMYIIFIMQHVLFDERDTEIVNKSPIKRWNLSTIHLSSS